MDVDDLDTFTNILFEGFKCFYVFGQCHGLQGPEGCNPVTWEFGSLETREFLAWDTAHGSPGP